MLRDASSSLEITENAVLGQTPGPGLVPLLVRGNTESRDARPLVFIRGLVFYDSHHAGESENIALGRADNWRATAWEIHPITNFEIRRVN